MMKILLALAALLVVGESHLCLLNPFQRGPPVPISSLNTAGSKECALTMGPCGGVNATNGDEITAFAAGEQIVVTMQKNLDHYNAAAPGEFSISLYDGAGVQSKFGSVADTSYPSLSIYEVVGTIPNLAQGRYALQAVYTTSNPNAPAAFYQCADVHIVRPPPSSKVADGPVH